jgi:hypothetical protein
MENYYEYDVGAGKYLQWYVVRLEKWYGDERNNREHPNFVIRPLRESPKHYHH